MSPIVEKLLLQIACICLRITTQGNWHAHFNIAPHTRGVTVEILPASTDYMAPQSHPRALSRVCYYQNAPGFIEHDEASLTERAITELEGILSDLIPFLSNEPTERPAAEPLRQYNTLLSDESLAVIQRLAIEGGMADLQLSTGALDHSALLQVDRIDHPHGYGLEATLSTGKQRHSLTLGVHDGLHTTRLCEWVETIAHGRLSAAA